MGERKRPRGLNRSRQVKAAQLARAYGAGDIRVGHELGEYPPRDLGAFNCRGDYVYPPGSVLGNEERVVIPAEAFKGKPR